MKKNEREEKEMKKGLIWKILCNLIDKMQNRTESS
jgi:hypothetical protein